MALAAVFLPTSILFYVGTWVAERDAGLAQDVDPRTAHLLRLGTLAFDATWVLILALAFATRRRNPYGLAWLEHLTLQLVAISLGLAGHFLGLATTPFALAQLGALVIGLLLFRRGAVLLAAVSCAVIGVGTAIASQVGWIPYGPLFRAVPVQGGRIEPIFHGVMMLIVVVTVGIVLGVFLFVLGRLHDREAHLEQLSRTDPLTGLMNRREFFDALDREIRRAERRGAWLSVAILDLDHFKAVNDQYGHLAGDAVLIAAAHALGEVMRREDSLARYGGEEFVLLLPDTDAPGARAVAERCRARLQSLQIEVEGTPIRVTASFGVAARGPGVGGEALVRAADDALYRAKREGRNRVEVAA
jgi:diguanylate cyclase (GGDEF)-like protein